MKKEDFSKLHLVIKKRITELEQQEEEKRMKLLKSELTEDEIYFFDLMGEVRKIFRENGELQPEWVFKLDVYLSENINKKSRLKILRGMKEIMEENKWHKKVK